MRGILRAARGGRWVRAVTSMLLLAPVAGELEASPLPDPRADEPVLGLPCEGCEAVFDGLRAEELDARGRIAPAHEPGEPLVIGGTVRDRTGAPVAGIVVYAYHTNAHGVYPRDEDARTEAGRRHGTLRGWVRTDAGGRYVFVTIRPASYPDGRTPAHVHMHVIEPGCCTYYIDSIHFADDPRLSPGEREAMRAGRGASGLVSPVREPDGTWHVTRDIVLGLAVPGYTPRTRDR